MAPSQPPVSTLVAIRAAHHAEVTPHYDRIVFEFRGPVPLLQIEYVEQITGAGSGLPIPVAGNAILQVQFRPAQAHNDQGQPTAPCRISFNLPNVDEVVSAGDFEGVVPYGIGLDHKAETRIITLANPSRVVIDVEAP
jgi:hypothetical protein